MITVYAEIESIEEAAAEAPGAGREGAEATPLGPMDVVPIEYAAVPGTTTNMPGSHAYPDAASPMVASKSVVKGRLLPPHSGSFEITVGAGPASGLQAGRVRLSLAEG
jgi:hypothetical protein